MFRKIASITVVVTILMIFSFCVFLRSPQEQIISYVQEHVDELTYMAEKALDAESVKDIQCRDIESIFYLADPPVVAFRYQCSGGIASTSYYGFYYSKRGEPVGFQGVDMSFAMTEAGWMWHEQGGDNWYCTKFIMPNWYLYEMHF